MLRVLHISGSMDRAGAETMVMNLYRFIDKESYQFDFVYFTDKKCDYDDEIEALGGRIHRIPFKNPLKRMQGLIRLLKKHPEYRIVHAHTLFSIGFHLLAAKITGVPYRIAHSHNTSNKSKGKILGYVYESFSKKILNTFSTHFIGCGIAASKYLFYKPENALLLPNAIDTNHFALIGEQGKNYLHKEFDTPENVLKIIQVGRLQSVKNPLFSLKIAKALYELNIDFRFFFIGQGDLSKELQMEINKQQLESKVKLLGVRSDIPQLMAGADALLMPSIHEGFPVVLVESQSVGLPALISDSISNEVDLGVGLVHFESLNNSPSIWAERLQHMERYSKTDTKKRIEKLADSGFDIVLSANRLKSLYKTMQ